MEKPNLLWEILRYQPRILYTLEPTQIRLRKSLCHDMSHFHYFLESQFGFTNVRDLDVTQCKDLLKSIYDHGMLFYIHIYKSQPSSIVYHLKWFDCNTQQVQVYNLPQLHDIGYDSQGLPQFWTLDQNTSLISGGRTRKQEILSACYTYRIATFHLVPKDHMNEPRHGHGLQKMPQKIFSFGGFYFNAHNVIMPYLGGVKSYDLSFLGVDSKFIFLCPSCYCYTSGYNFDKGIKTRKSAEVYDVLKNQWKNLPDMPESGMLISCVRAQNQILISSTQFRLVSFDIENEAYSYVGQENNGFDRRIIVSSKEKLYLFEFQSRKIFEMTKQCEVVDTITNNTGLKCCFQSYTNTEGRIFMLQHTGKVWCFDPFGERQLTEVRHLRKDQHLS